MKLSVTLRANISNALDVQLPVMCRQHLSYMSEGQRGQRFTVFPLTLFPSGRLL